MEDPEEESDVMELIQSKGGVLDAFKNEWTELEKTIENTLATNLEKEREVDFQNVELKSVREQLTLARRNVDELLSQQEMLKETIEHINQKREGLVERESKNREEIGVYSGLFGELKDSLSVGGDWSPEQLEQRILLEKERDFLSSKLENSNNQLTGVRSEIDHIYESIHILEKENTELDNEIELVDSSRHQLKKDTASMVVSKEELEKSIHQLRAEIVTHENDFAEKHRMKKAEEKSLHSLDLSIAKSKSQMEIYISNYDQLYRTLQEATQNLEKQNQNNEKLQAEIDEKMQYIEKTNIDSKKLVKELSKVNQLKQLTQQNCLDIDAKKHSTENTIEEIQNKIATLREIDMHAVSKDIDNQDKQFTTLKQELDILRKKTTNSERTAKTMTDLMQLNKNGKLNLLLEIKILEEEVTHSKNQIKLLLTEKEKFEHDAEVANQQYYTSLEELKLQELQISELNKKIISDTTKLKQKQSLYDSVRSDRNLYSKQLVDSQSEISALKLKFRTMNHSIEQMKEEISAKDHMIVKEHFLHHSVDKERELLKNELTKIKKQVQSSEVIIDNQRIEIMKLQRIIEEADQESQRQKNELASVLSERNLLTAQLVKRNNELSEMYHKIKVYRSNLRMGERNFHSYFTQMHEIKENLYRTIVEHNDCISKLGKAESLRQCMLQLERDLLKERTKTRALQDELETPMNVHRWRILESSDPKKYDKITQISALQKQLIAMSDKIVQTDLLIQEKEKIYVELKNVISRQPGPEVEEQILVYQQTHKDKTKQLAAMNQELEMYMEQVQAFKNDIADCDQKMSRMNKAWMRRLKKAREFNQ